MDNRRRVLIVDDDEMVCRVVERVLGRDYVVRVAARGEEALGLLTDGERFDLILTDFAMPRMDGAQLIELIGQLDRAQADRVIFITANALSAMVETSALHAIVDKPFSPRKLRELVDRVTAANEDGYFPTRDDDLPVPGNT